MGPSALLLLCALLTTPTGEGGHAIFDAGQSGDLPSVTIDRPAAALHDDRSVAAADDPRWGALTATADAMGGWDRVWDVPLNLNLLISGFQADGESPMLAAVDGNQMNFHVFTSERIEAGPQWTHSMWRHGTGPMVVDILEGSPAQRPNHAYRPRAGTVLPGCFVLLCQRSRLVDQDDGTQAWLAEGISIVALDRATGDWVFRLIGDLPRIGGDDDHLGRERIFASSLANYFPDPDGVVDGTLTDAWIPFVDYLLHTPTPATAGQCGLVRARRKPFGTSQWMFDGPVLLHEFEGGTKRHTHAAAWTPNGVLLSIGDSADSEVLLLKHEAGTSWLDSDNWTTWHDMHGAPLADGEGGDVGANQFWSVAPGIEPNTVICGGDNVSGAIMRTIVPEDPLDGIRFERLWGVQPADTGDGGAAQCTCSSMHRASPESGGPLMARFYLESPFTQANEARLLVSEDGTHFATTAGLRKAGSKASPVALYGDTMLTTPLGTLADHGIYQMPMPGIDVRRPLRIGPGSTNELHVASHEGDLAIEAIDNAEVSEISRTGSDDLSTLAAIAPGHGPVWRVRRDTVGGVDLASVSLPTPEGGWPSGPLWAQLSFCNLTDGMVRPQVRFDLGPIDPHQRIGVASKNQWVPFDLVTQLDDPIAGVVPPLVFSVPSSGPAPPADFLITLESLTQSSAPPWPSAEPMGQRPAERVSLALEPMAVPWITEFDLALPAAGFDRGLGDRFPFIPLLTLQLEDGSALQLLAEQTYKLVHLYRIWANGTVQTLLTHYHVRMSRLESMRIKIAAVVGGVGMDVVSGGRRGPIEQIDGTQCTTLPPIVGVTFGDEHGDLSIPMDVLRVSLWPEAGDVDIGIELDVDLSCQADLDGDGIVGGSDILMILTSWGDCPPPDGDVTPPCHADLDGNGIVGVPDLLVLITSLGPCPTN